MIQDRSAVHFVAALLFLLLALLTSLPGAVLAQQKLLSFGESLAFEPLGPRAAVVNLRKVEVNAASLEQVFSLEIPGNDSVSGKPETVTTRNHRNGAVTTSISGKLYQPGVEAPGEYVISRTLSPDGEEGYHGNFTTPDGKLFILGHSSAESGTVLSQIDESKQLECGGPALSYEHEHLHEKPAYASSVPSSSAASIRVLVAYTPDAVTTAGSESALLSIISAMIANGNTAHANSQTGITLELAGTYALSTQSNDDFVGELSAATNTGDGKWDELGTLREQFCADMVSVIVGGTNGGSICGIAWIGGSADVMPFYKSQMFSVVSANQAICSQYTFVHELGHNFGSDHDAANASGGSPAYSYSYGWRFTGGSGPQYRTVMAYSPGTRIAYFSNPAVSFDGVATGNGTANNASSHSLTSPVVAAFYGEGESCDTDEGSPSPTPVPTAVPQTGPDTVELTSTSKRKGSKTRVKIQMYATELGAPSVAAPLRLVYDKSVSGTFETVISEKSTNSKGVATYNTYLDRLKSGYYQACYFGTSQTICSNLLRKKGRSKRSSRRRS